MMQQMSLDLVDSAAALRQVRETVEELVEKAEAHSLLLRQAVADRREAHEAWLVQLSQANGALQVLRIFLPDDPGLRLYRARLNQCYRVAFHGYDLLRQDSAEPLPPAVVT